MEVEPDAIATRMSSFGDAGARGAGSDSRRRADRRPLNTGVPPAGENNNKTLTLSVIGSRELPQLEVFFRYRPGLCQCRFRRGYIRLYRAMIAEFVSG
jgi:hypothetical protein